MPEKHYSIVDLSSYFNSKGISWIEKNIFAQINHINESLAGEFLPNDKIIHINSIPLKFPKTDINNNDLVCCEEQIIAIDHEQIREIVFLGFCTWGHYLDILKVIYDDGTFDEKPFGFPDWQDLQNTYLEEYETKSLEFDYYRYNRELIKRKNRLYKITISVDAAKRVTSFKLPDNVYCYICSLTLMK